MRTNVAVPLLTVTVSTKDVIFISERNEDCWRGRKVKDTIRLSVPLSLFKWEYFYGIILYKAEHRNNSRRSQKLMEFPDEELPL